MTSLKKLSWESDKRIKLDGIRIDCGDIGLTTQCYDQVPVVVELDLVYILYCGKLPQAQSHTQLVHGNIATTQFSGTKDKRSSAIHKSQLVAEDDNIIGWKLNRGKDFYNKLSKEIVI